MKTTAKSILDSHASSTPSKWRERAEYRRNNRKWIRRSQQIALAILERLTELGMSQKELAEERASEEPREECIQLLEKELKTCKAIVREREFYGRVAPINPFPWFWKKLFGK